MNDVLKIVLPVYLIAYFIGAFVWRSYLVWKRTGVNPYAIGRGNKPVDFIELLYKIPMILILLTTVAFCAFPRAYAYATPITWLENFYVQVAGLVLMGFAFIWTATAQMQMGASWRIGIDEENRTDLVEKGLFSVSRNPIFVGIRTALWGFFLTVPSAATLLAVAMADVLMQIQVRLEEEFLTGQHGDKYTEFRGRVRRWI